jgi:hypothetical protein
VWRSRTGIVEFEDSLGCRRLVGIDAGWDRRLLGIKDSFGLKICWDQSLVAIKDWRSETRFVGIEDLETRWDQRLGIKDFWGQRLGVEDLGSKTWDQRLVGIKDWVVGIKDMGSMTRLDQRLVWIEDLLGSKTITSCCGSRKLLFCVREFVCCCSFFELLWFAQDLVLCRVMGLYTNLHVEMATSTRRLSIISWYSFPFLRKPTHLMCNSKTITSSIPK